MHFVLEPKIATYLTFHSKSVNALTLLEWILPSCLFSVFSGTIDIPRKGFYCMKTVSIPPVRFIQEVITELKKVTWPTRQETIKLTMVVVTVSAGIGLFVGGLDILLVNISKLLFK